MSFRNSAFSALAVWLAACGDDAASNIKKPVRGAGKPPFANLSVTPPSGLIPLAVTLDASASFDVEDPLSKLLFRWDADGDGTWETDFANSPTFAHTYLVPGVFMATVEVQDRNMNVGMANVQLFAYSGAELLVDLDADSNRDGIIDDADDVNENVFANTHGAMLLANLDDDNSDGDRDSLNAVIDSNDDLADTAPLVLHQMPELTTAHRVEISVTPESAALRVRVFWPTSSGYIAVTNGEDATAIIADPMHLKTSDVTLRIEAITGRSGKWDGYAMVTARVREGSNVIGQDSVQFRVAPTILPDNTRPAEVLYVMRIPGDNLPFYNALDSNLPASVTLYTVRASSYGYDRWVQDNMQTGYQEIVVGEERQRMNTYMQAERPTGNFGLENLLPIELLRENLGYTYQGGSDTSHNYGGNLEITPPFYGAPYGRIIIGGGNGGTLTGRPNTDRMTAVQREWLDAQEVQGPTVEVSSEWLAVGHIDEIFQFVPDPSSTDDTPFKLVLASPDLAVAALVELAQTQSGAVVFAGRDSQTTVADILEDEDLLAYNVSAQARIDTVREALTELMALSSEDIVEVPVMFEEVAQTGGLALAFSPGVQNLVTINDTLFVPDPEGPSGDNGDIWQRLILDALEPLGLTVHFVDVFESYHELWGEAHCGTNVQLGSYATAWWEL